MRIVITLLWAVPVAAASGLVLVWLAHHQPGWLAAGVALNAVAAIARLR